MDLTQFQNLKFRDLSERRNHEPGWYEGRFVGMDSEEFPSNNGTSLAVKLFFVAENPLEGQNMAGVNTGRRLQRRITIWGSQEDSDKATETAVVTDALKALDPSLGSPGEGGDEAVKDMFEQRVNTPVRVRIEGDKNFAKRNDGKYFPVVAEFKAMA